MTQLLYKFTLQSAKFHPAVLVCVVLVWIAVIWCAITSINSQPFTPRQRSFWVVVVVIFPIIGLLAYLPFSFRKEDLPQLFLSKRHKRSGAESETTPKGTQR